MRYRVTNWSEYDAALVWRGSLTLWVTEEALGAWHAPATSKRGGQLVYSDVAIETSLALRLVFHQPLRQTEGAMRSIIDLLGLDLPIPDHTTFSRRGGGLMMLPQRPHFPIASLKAAIVYPSEPDAYGSEAVSRALSAVGLPQLSSRLEEEGHWNRMLSPGEQQRLGLARALLHRPQYLFLDEATASLDEASEATLYRLLAEQLPMTTVVSIGHRSTLEPFHQRHIVLDREGDRFALHEEERPASHPKARRD